MLEFDYAMPGNLDATSCSFTVGYTPDHSMFRLDKDGTQYKATIT